MKKQEILQWVYDGDTSLTEYLVKLLNKYDAIENVIPTQSIEIPHGTKVVRATVIVSSNI